MRPSLLLLAAVAVLGCAPVEPQWRLTRARRHGLDIRPESLPRAAPFTNRREARRAGEAPNRRVAVRRSDGRTRMINQRFDALVVPVEGPPRLFRRPVAARLEDGVLIVSGLHRPESRIPLDMVDAVVVFHR